MVDNYIHKNPRDAVEERFFRMENKVVHISRNMALVTVVLTNKFRYFAKVSRSNSEGRSKWKFGYSEDLEKDSRKELEK